MIIESGFLEEKVLFNGYGNVQLKMQFVLSEEDRNRIRFLVNNFLIMLTCSVFMFIGALQNFKILMNPLVLD